MLILEKQIECPISPLIHPPSHPSIETHPCTSAVTQQELQQAEQLQSRRSSIRSDPALQLEAMWAEHAQEIEAIRSEVALKWIKPQKYHHQLLK